MIFSISPSGDPLEHSQALKIKKGFIVVFYMKLNILSCFVPMMIPKGLYKVSFRTKFLVCINLIKHFIILLIYSTSLTSLSFCGYTWLFFFCSNKIYWICQTSWEKQYYHLWLSYFLLVFCPSEIVKFSSWRSIFPYVWK